MMFRKKNVVAYVKIYNIDTQHKIYLDKTSSQMLSNIEIYSESTL